MYSLANWVAIVSAGLMITAFVVGLSTRPGPEYWPRPQAANALPTIIPFTPGASFAGEHKYGLWTLYCRPGTPGAEIGAAPASPTTPDLGTNLPAPLAAALRCVAHARIQVKTGATATRILAEFNVFTVGPDRKPYIILTVPVKAKTGKQVNFQIDENFMFIAPIGECGDTSCTVQGELPQAALTQMLSGKELRLRLFPEGTDQPIDFGYPLYGFKESYAGLALAQPVPDAQVTPPPVDQPPASAGETPPAAPTP